MRVGGMLDVRWASALQREDASVPRHARYGSRPRERTVTSGQVVSSRRPRKTTVRTFYAAALERTKAGGSRLVWEV